MNESAIVYAVNIYGGQYEKMIYPRTKHGGLDWPEWVKIDLSEYRRLQQELKIIFIDGDYVAFDFDAQLDAEHREWCEQFDENQYRGQGWL